MSYYFFDTSALVKRYVQEVGTNWVLSILSPNSGNVICIARITPIEIMSGVYRLQRSDIINERQAQAILLWVQRHMQREYRRIDLSAAVSARAIELLRKYPLRAYDAVQLASAFETNHRLTSADLTPLTFVSADQRLIISATAEGLSVADPNQLP